MKIQLSDHFTYRRLIRFILPTVAMMVYMSIYSIVDGFFVSNFAGKTPFAAVNLVMPVLMILSTVGFMLGTGGTAIVAKTFGEGDGEKANRYFSLFVYTSFAVGVFFAAVAYILAPQIASMLKATGELHRNCVRYMRVVLLALPFSIMQMMFQSFFPAAEKPKLGFLVTAASGVLNMILDAALCLTLPQELKLTGAAIATAASQTLGGVVSFAYFFSKNSSILRLGKTRFEGRILLKACVNGSSEFMSNISMSVVGMLYNFQLIKYAGENGVSAYGVMMYVSMIFMMVFVGFSIGVSPVISFNYGAQNINELKGLLKKSLIICGTLGVIMVASAELLAVPLADLFVGYDAELKTLTVSGLRIFAFGFAFMGFGIFTSGFFTALNDGITSAIISFVRTLLLEAAFVMLLPLVFGIDGIWYSTLLAEFISLLLGVVFLIVKRKRFRY